MNRRHFRVGRGVVVAVALAAAVPVALPTSASADPISDQKAHVAQVTDQLEALDEVAAAHSVEVAAVAVAWLAAQPGITAPIASARNPEQLATLLPAVGLTLSAGELARLDEASA